MNKTRKLDGNKNSDKTGAKAKKPQKRNKQTRVTGSLEKRSGDKEKQTKLNPQLYVGMDVHKKTIQMAVMDKNKKVLKNENISHTPSRLKGFLKSLPKNTKYVMESSSVWYNTFRIMRDDLGLDVILSNPYQTRLIAASKKKTDKMDATILADLLRCNYIAPCYVPPHPTIQNRQLVYYRDNLIRSRTSFKNRIHGILLQNGIKLSGSPFSRQFLAGLQRLKDYRIDGYLEIIESINGRITKADAAVRHATRNDHYSILLQSIPGIGSFTALTLSSMIDDIDRFPDSHHLAAYAGLVPSVRNSADVVRHGHITKMGSGMMRWVLMECVWTHSVFAPNSDITIFYKRLAKKRGKSKAAVAAASKLLRVIYWMLKEKREFVTNYS